MYWKTKILILKKTFTTFRKVPTADDVFEAYWAAALAKKKWDAVNPFEKRTILEKSRHVYWKKMKKPLFI
ncbi:hypothetical protein [Bacillus subtilis]|uniref:hypothetical protein n=1 Tax=Bacillus subtilis TaxID=1423 RepID=UPI0037BE7F80